MDINHFAENSSSRPLLDHTWKNHTQSFDHYKLETPLAFLHRSCASLLHSKKIQDTASSSSRYGEYRIHVSESDSAHIATLWADSASLDHGHVIAEYFCPYCDLVISKTTALVSQAPSKTHDHGLYHPHVFRYSLDAAEGRPCCRHCGCDAQSWATLHFANHIIELGECQPFLFSPVRKPDHDGRHPRAVLHLCNVDVLHTVGRSWTCCSTPC